MKTIMDRLVTLKPQNQTGTRRKENLYVFLALKGEIAQAIYHGWTARSIWELLTHERKLSCSYENFVRLCKRHGITKSDLTPEKIALINQQHRQTGQEIVSNKNCSFNPSNHQEFNYNPNADIQELI